MSGAHLMLSKVLKKLGAMSKAVLALLRCIAEGISLIEAYYSLASKYVGLDYSALTLAPVRPPEHCK